MFTAHDNILREHQIKGPIMENPNLQLNKIIHNFHVKQFLTFGHVRTRNTNQL